VEYDEIEDPLPFDIEAPVIEIKDEDYAIWYRDMAEDMKKYDKKTISFTALTAKNSKLPANVFIAGRHVMTCCVDDIQYSAVACEYKDAKKIKNKGWIKLTEGSVVLTREEWESYATIQTRFVRTEEMKNLLLAETERLRKRVVKAREQARKETAREILDKVDKESNGQTKQITDVIRKQFGV
jgi:hypothetical protein